MNRQARLTDRRGFTLVELLVVITIILLVSAVALPTVISAYTHRQVSEAARILQAGLVGARDVAINNNAPAGIRLLPDPSFPIQYTTINIVNQINPATILASNRFVPIQLAPDYSEGKVSIINDVATPFAVSALPYGAGQFVPYPVASPGKALMVEQCPVYQDPTTGTWLLNSPTSWFWNIRVGDRIQIGNASQVYVVVGPLWVSPANPSAPGNDELFVNIGYPGSEVSNYVLRRNYGDPSSPHTVEYLLLVNARDDNNNGYVDEGWDGVNNDEVNGTDDPLEWEVETWLGGLANLRTLPLPFAPLTGILNQPYTVTRRPVVSPGARETPLPSSVVIDLTTWNPAAFGAGYVSERSRLPVDSTTGSVDILLNPNGTVVPTTVYSSPSSFGMSSAFYHFWLAERTDLYDPLVQSNVPYLLPMVPSTANNYPNPNDGYGASRALKGERLLVTLYTRTGQIVTNQIESFDGSTGAVNGGVNLPFLLPQQGVRGDTR